MTSETPKEPETVTTVPTPKITAEKPTPKIKDPRRVAQGKKLAEISKQAKERKMRETIQQEMLENRNDSTIPFGYIVGTVGLAIAAGALYYGYDPQKIEKTAPQLLEPVPPPDEPVKSNLDSFD